MDPMVVAEVQDPRTQTWDTVSHTERMNKNFNPDFTQPLVFTRTFTYLHKSEHTHVHAQKDNCKR
jgi:hypothetical protein